MAWLAVLSWSHATISDGNYAVQLPDSKMDRVVEFNSSDLIRHNRESYSFIQPQVILSRIPTQSQITSLFNMSSAKVQLGTVISTQTF